MMKPYDHKNGEEAILKFWLDKDIYAKAKKKNKGSKKFYYLDGPPYVSGKVHIGTAWGKVLRDSLLRYKRMNGIDVYDRAGFDMHGLPTENPVAKKLGLNHKKDIEAYGLEKFQEQCKKFCLENMEAMIKDFKRLGVWMDFDNPYTPIDPKYIESEWWLIKQADAKGRLYEGKKSMHWCAHCATSLSKHELDYKNVTDTSVFLKFKVHGKKDEFLVVWTTTPWTIPFNLAVMVNPDIEYIKAKVEKETWIVAKALAGLFIGSVAGKTFTIQDEFRGSELNGLSYEHPLAKEIPEFLEIKKKHPKLHTVVLSTEYVDTTAGTGLVHCAPGCGPEDFEVGKKEDLPAYNELDEQGTFKTGAFKGMQAKKDDKKFIAIFEKSGALIATAEVDHDYAHCWRCGEGVVFRTTDQWFFKVEDLKEKFISMNKQVTWVPKEAFNAFDSWLKNLKDNGITRQRYWGTPVPIWKCDKCTNYEVIGSFKELKEKAGTLPKDFHKSYVDALTWKCTCGGTKKRIPDILDVWIDAGTASWATLGYPQETALFKELFPADFILEGKDQIRGWFNMLMVASMLALEKNSFKAVYMHGFINDSQGRKMSKSQQNYILPSEVVDHYGADTLRYYTIGAANPGLDLAYNPDDAKLKNKNLLILWNLQNFVIDMAKHMGFNPVLIKEKAVTYEKEEEYILSRLHTTVKKMTHAFETYALNETPGIAEALYMDLSRVYIQLVREKSAHGTEKEKQQVLYTAYTVLMNLIKLMSPIIPFFTEQVFQNLKEAFHLPEESIHLMEWPEAQKKYIDEKLESQMLIAQDIISTILALREKHQLGVRWPVQEIVLDTKNKDVKEAAEELKDLIMRQCNAKTFVVKHISTDLAIKPNYKTMGIHFGQKTGDMVDIITEHEQEIVEALKNDKEEVKLEGVVFKKDFFDITRKLPDELGALDFRHGTIFMNIKLNESLEAEGYAREIIRRVQQLRKDSGLVKTDKIDLFIVLDQDLLMYIKDWEDTISEKTGCKAIQVATKKEGHHDHSLKQKIKGKSVELWLKKV